MQRLHLIEIHDQEWCPRAIRNAETDYLQFVIATTKPCKAVVPILAGALRWTGARQVTDLCFGAGGPWLSLHPLLVKQGRNLAVCLPDKYPNLHAVPASHPETDGAVHCHPQAVDATRVPDALPGFRTSFTAFHHFSPRMHAYTAL